MTILEAFRLSDELVLGGTLGPWYDFKTPNRSFVRENYTYFTPVAINVFLRPFCFNFACPRRRDKLGFFENKATISFISFFVILSLLNHDLEGRRRFSTRSLLKELTDWIGLWYTFLVSKLIPIPYKFWFEWMKINNCKITDYLKQNFSLKKILYRR